MSPHASWVLQQEIIPRLNGTVPRVVKCVGSEDPEELVQDAIVFAAIMTDRIDKQGKLKPGKVGGCNIAYYTMQHMKSGRRACGASTTDVYGSGTQLNGRADTQSLNEVVAEDQVSGFEIFELQDVISKDTEDPAVQAARKMDWDSFMASLNHMEVLLVEFLSAGKSLRKAAHEAGLSPSRMLSYRDNVAAKLLEFMGEDILRDIAQVPKWRIGLECEIESRACRAERRN